MKRSVHMGEDPIFPLVVKLAVPTMIAQLVNVLYSIIDRMYIGNIPEIGSTALAGVGVCGPIVTLLGSFGTLVGLGGSILMAMRMGEKKNREAKDVLSNSFLMLCVLSFVLTVVFLCTKEQLLYWFGASANTFSYANTYVTIYTLGTFFALMAIGLNYFITCQGFPMISMLTVVIGAVTNIVLDPIFIFVLQMDVAGAAFATVCAQLISCVFALTFLFSSKVKIKISFGGYSKRVMGKILGIGISPFVILASDSAIIILFNTMLQRFGGATQGDLLISAATVVQSYMLLITGPMIGITGGTQSIISFNYGARNIHRVKQAEKYIFLLCSGFAAAMFLLTQWVAPGFVRFFTGDSETVALAVWGIRTFTLAVIPLSIQYCIVDGLTALGRTKTALFLSMLRKGIYGGSLLVIPLFLSPRALFYGEPITDVISAAVSGVIFVLVFGPHLEERLRQQ